MRVRYERDVESVAAADERPRTTPLQAEYSAAHIASLQRSAGNHAVTRLLRSGRMLQRDLTKEEYDQIKEIAQQIMKRYPPAKYRYVGLGKSPTPVLAFLQSYGEEVGGDVQAINMPLSKFGHPTSDMSSGETKFVDGHPLTAEQHDRLWDHFDAFIGPFNDPGTPKDIVLIDHVESGKSLFASARHLEHYLHERYFGTGVGGMFWSLMSKTGCCVTPPPKVEMLPLAIEEQQATKGNEAAMEALGLKGRALMLPGELEDTSSLAARMGGEHYKKTAEYPADFKISASDNPTTAGIQRDPRGLYAELRSQVTAFIRKDGDLVRQLRGDDALVRLDEEADSLLIQMERVPVRRDKGGGSLLVELDESDSV